MCPREPDADCRSPGGEKCTARSGSTRGSAYIAPGETIFSAIPGDLYNDGFGSGTSFAAALVSAAAAIEICWHYSFVVVFISLKLVLAITLLRRRSPLASWLATFAIHRPASITQMTHALECA